MSSDYKIACRKSQFNYYFSSIFRQFEWLKSQSIVCFIFAIEKGKETGRECERMLFKKMERESLRFFILFY
jgi:hypothetical protein